MKKFKIGMIGYGTVGKGVVKILKDNAEHIAMQLGVHIQLDIIVVRELEKYRHLPELQNIFITNDMTHLLQSDVDIVIEVMGGLTAAYDVIKQALLNGKHVVTANKDVIAKHGNELMTIAFENHCDLFYEASVGGGIPILRTLENSLSSDYITEIMGILNGSTNYILTKMTQENMAYDEALKIVQQLGFAESDPYNDVSGLDSARKMVILSRLAHRMNIDLNDIRIQGIQKISKEDIVLANQLGYHLKLIGLSRVENQHIYVEVGPTMVSKQHPLAHVNFENNAIYVKGATFGENLFSGPGAGKLPTAHSVISDVLNICQNVILGTTGNQFAFQSKEKKLLPWYDIEFPYYFRIAVEDRPGMFLLITQIFSAFQSSFHHINQVIHSDGTASIMVVTHPMTVETYNKIVDKMINHEEIELQMTMRVM